MSFFLRSRLPALLIGLVFVVSAALKMVDPVGTSLIVGAYLKFLHLGFLDGFAMPIGVALCMIEMIVGVGLVTGVSRRFFAISTLVLLSFFTLVSILLVVFNPDMHCGCFGEFIHLTHTQTLVKNIVLLVMALVAFIPLYELGFASHYKWASFSVTVLLMTAFAAYPLFFEPIGDFMKYKPSHTIVLQSQQYGSEFSHPTLPIRDADGVDCSDVVVDGEVMVISVYDPESITPEQLKNLAFYAQDALNCGFDNVIALSPSDYFEIPGVDTYVADYKDLLSMNRSNGGCTYLSDGYIYYKHRVGKTLGREELTDILAQGAEQVYADNATIHSLAVQAFCIVLIFGLLLL